MARAVLRAIAACCAWLSLLCSPAVAVCPEESIELSNTCYHTRSRSSHYFEAAAYCREWGGTMAVVPNAKVFLDLQNYLSQQGVGDAFLGLRKNHNLQFEWVDGTPLRFQAWRTQPSNSLALCAVQQQGGWSEIGCDQYRGSLCQKPADTPFSPEPSCSFTAEGRCFSPALFQQTYGDAQQMCETWGGDLASIPSEIVNVAASQVVAQWTDSYIGFSRTSPDSNTFEWEDGSATTFTGWNGGEPNNAGGIEGCAVINKHGGWNDATCDVPRPFLCSKPLSSCPPGESPLPNAESITCQPCPTGMFKTDAGVHDCIPCHNTKPSSERYVGDGVTSELCPYSSLDGNECAPGFSWNSVQQSCQPCPPGQFTSLPGRTTCESCPLSLPKDAEFEGHGGSSQACAYSPVEGCGPGYTLETETRLCRPCGVGTFMEEPGDECQQCSNKPENAEYVQVEGMRTNACPYACYLGWIGVSCAVPCAGPACMDCPAGWSWSDARSRCEPCPSGTFKGEAGPQACQPCESKPHNAWHTSTGVNTSQCPFQCQDGFMGPMCDEQGCAVIEAGYCYKLGSYQWMSYWDAEAACEGIGASLATIPSEAAQAAVFDTLGSMFGAMWIGLQKESYRGQYWRAKFEPWTWADGASSEFRGWGPDWEFDWNLRWNYDVSEGCVRTMSARDASWTHSSCAQTEYPLCSKRFGCPPGLELRDGVCLPCPTGTYKSWIGLEPCAACELGRPNGTEWVGQGGSSMLCMYAGQHGNASDCEAGYELDEHTGWCTPCAVGTFKSPDAAGPCLPCRNKPAEAEYTQVGWTTEECPFQCNRSQGLYAFDQGCLLCDWASEDKCLKLWVRDYATGEVGVPWSPRDGPYGSASGPYLKSWTESAEACEAAGGTLATLDSAEENLAMSVLTLHWRTYIGLRWFRQGDGSGPDSNADGTWFWADGAPYSPASDYGAWIPGQTPSYETGNINYVALQYDSWWTEDGPGHSGHIRHAVCMWRREGCPAGQEGVHTWHGLWTGSCKPCPPGTFKPKAGLSRCLPCGSDKPPASAYAAWGQTSPLCSYTSADGADCGPGFGWDAHTGECSVCRLGYFKTEAGPGACSRCGNKPSSNSDYIEEGVSTRLCPYACHPGFVGIRCQECSGTYFWDVNKCFSTLTNEDDYWTGPKCGSVGGILASIKTEAEHLAVSEFGQVRHYTAAIGLKFYRAGPGTGFGTNVKGLWRWEDGTAFVPGESFAFWKAGEPNIREGDTNVVCTGGSKGWIVCGTDQHEDLYNVCQVPLGCPPGSHASGQYPRLECALCSAGTYKRLPGVEPCTPCTNLKPAGAAYSGEGSTTNDCPFRCRREDGFLAPFCQNRCDGAIVGRKCWAAQDVAMIWTEANTACGEWGGTLAVVADAEENAAAVEVLRGVGAGTGWIGLQLTEPDVGTWTWPDQSSYSSEQGSVLWAAGEPTLAGSPSCVTISGSDGQRSSGQCTDAHAFVCSMPVDDCDPGHFWDGEGCAACPAGSFKREAGPGPCNQCANKPVTADYIGEGAVDGFCEFRCHEQHFGARCVPCTDGTVVRGKCFWSVFLEPSFERARDKCGERGGTLATIASWEENAALSQQQSHPHLFRIGLRWRQGTAGSWTAGLPSVWGWDDGEPHRHERSFAPWGQGEPALDAAGGVEQCVVWVMGEWFVKPCDEWLSMYALCSFDAERRDGNKLCGASDYWDGRECATRPDFEVREQADRLLV